MRKLYKIEEVVKNVLEQYPETRSDNFKLIYSVYREINFKVVTIENFYQVMWYHKEYGLPSFEGITRARRKIMNMHPELKPIKSVEKARKEEEIVYREYAIN